MQSLLITFEEAIPCACLSDLARCVIRHAPFNQILLLQTPMAKVTLQRRNTTGRSFPTPGYAVEL